MASKVPPVASLKDVIVARSEILATSILATMKLFPQTPILGMSGKHHYGSVAMSSCYRFILKGRVHIISASLWSWP